MAGVICSGDGDDTDDLVILYWWTGFGSTEVMAGCGTGNGGGEGDFYGQGTGRNGGVLEMEFYLFSIYIFVVNILSSRNSANWLQGAFINKRSYYYY